MRDLRILFMGTPEFAVHILAEILKEKFNVVGVVTAPDKPAGRGRKVHQSAVKKYALEKNIEVLQPTNLKAEEFQEDLNRLNPNIQVVVAFRMLPKKVWNFPKYGTFNLHASLLPQYRGAAPINWAIINGEKITGVSTFFIDEKIDTGEMIFQEQIPIEKEDNAGTLHDKLMNLGGKLVCKTLKQIAEDSITTIPQEDHKELKTAYKLNKENTRIDWQKSGEEIYNHIRGLSPYPVAWTILENGNDSLNCKIHKAHFSEEKHSLANGELTEEDKTLKVAVQNGFIILEEIQLPGKRKMDVKSLLNGFQLQENAKMS
ncbi:methionyl-tRNA formyltransferase [Mesonia maritima]|uniref:Methionyl-tRNA formyltransferase n=1 Tax=Mesonia maritima TaxID=1793873 RepID=A0ABU1K609_9FLAO|nr:methionyl-tRNA formyltransferase [Mesonia maritima]MDR6301054.1 methionyl-tRNA formyltransferase [Mesonia maritima]